MKYLRPETVSEIIEEIVPANTWGRKLDTLYADTGCAHDEVVEYENVVVNRATDQCIPLKPERESSATVTFKRSGCPPALVLSTDSKSNH